MHSRALGLRLACQRRLCIQSPEHTENVCVFLRPVGRQMPFSTAHLRIHTYIEFEILRFSLRFSHNELPHSICFHLIKDSNQLVA